LTFFCKNPTLTVSINEKENIVQTTISSKYQVVIPKPVREHLNLKPKQKLTVIEKDKMLILIPHASLDELRGIASGTRTADYREKKDQVI
jgi:AbrB family looped-hinge helix DNA binding protein